MYVLFLNLQRRWFVLLSLLLSAHRNTSAATTPSPAVAPSSADSPADGQVTRWSPIGEEAHGVAFLLGGGVDQSPLLQGLVDMGRVETFQWVTGLVLLEYLAEEGKLTLFLVGRDIIAIGIDVTKQGNI